MNSNEGWGESASQTFIEYGRYFVPERERQIGIIRDVIPVGGGACRVLELCCGEGLLAGAILERYPNCSVYGYDGSAEMLGQAQKNLAAYGERFVPHPFDLFESSWRRLDWSPRAVVSSLAIHHLDGRQKAALYRDIYALLEPGGAFIIADLIEPVNEAAMMAAAAEWDTAVRQRALAIDGHEKAYDFFVESEWNYFRHPDPMDKPSPLLAQLKWLEQAGFVEVDVFWLQAGHAIFGGRKKEQ
ncbi:MAG: class I SAM-dependent methyltransferase [Candidatus Promineifilaceae bacterium]